MGISNISELMTISQRYMQLGKCLYQGSFDGFVFEGKGDLTKYNDISSYKDYKGIQRTRDTLNVAKTISNYISKNIFAEPPIITIANEDGDDEVLTDLINEILEDNKFLIKESENFETQLPLGSRVVKPYVMNSKLKLAFIEGDLFVPIGFDESKNIVEGVMITTKAVLENRKMMHYTYLEWHLINYEVDDAGNNIEDINGDFIQNGRKIFREVYKSLTFGHLRTSCFGSLNKVFGIKVSEREIGNFANLEMPTFIYTKNPFKNNKDIHSPEGLGIFANGLDKYRSIDRAYTSLNLETEYGTIKLMVPEGATERTTSSNGGYKTRYDTENPLILVYSGSEIGESEPKVFAPDSRAASFIETINFNYDILSFDVGITVGSFRFDGKSMVTAQQVRSEDSETVETMKMYEKSLTEFYKDIIMTIKEYYDIFNLGNLSGIERKNINIKFNDNIFTDDESAEKRDLNLHMEGGMPMEEVLVQNRGLTPDMARDWISRRKAEEEFSPVDELSISPEEGETIEAFINRFVNDADVILDIDNEQERIEEANRIFNESGS